MVRNRRIISLYGLRVALFLSALAQCATVVDFPPIEYLARLASDIAVIKVESEDPVTFDYGGSRYVCGCRYRAQVETSFKGDAEEIEFTTASCSMFRGFDRNYLVFTEKVDATYLRNLRTRRLHSWESELGRARAVCVLSADKKTVQAGQAAMVAFHRDGADADADWLVADAGNIVSWGPYSRKRGTEDGREIELVAWDEVRAAIERAVAPE